MHEWRMGSCLQQSLELQECICGLSTTRIPSHRSGLLSGLLQWPLICIVNFTAVAVCWGAGGEETAYGHILHAAVVVIPTIASTISDLGGM